MRASCPWLSSFSIANKANSLLWVSKNVFVVVWVSMLATAEKVENFKITFWIIVLEVIKHCSEFYYKVGPILEKRLYSREEFYFKNIVLIPFKNNGQIHCIWPDHSNTIPWFFLKYIIWFSQVIFHQICDWTVTTAFIHKPLGTKFVDLITTPWGPFIYTFQMILHTFR